MLPVRLCGLLLAMSASFASPAAADSGSNSSGDDVRGAETDLPDLPREVTSFGATRLGSRLFAYGGHTGSAHSYSREEQANELWSLDLDDPEAGWTTELTGPPLQGNALVAADGRVVLLGGFTAMNADGEEQDLRSQAGVYAFAPGSSEWAELPPLPEPRSSFDAISDDTTIYAAGGWSMQNDAESAWHRTAWRLDLSADDPAWQPLPELLFPRRATALALHDGRLYLLGGMAEDGPTKSVHVLELGGDAWTEGPELVGDAMAGFGCAAVPLDGRLHVTTFDGAVQRLSEDGDAWEVVGQMPKKRFFHRLVPDGEDAAFILGGGDMSVGKYAEVEKLVVE